MSDIKLHIKDREGKIHQVLAPTDMAMSASCQCYVTSTHELSAMGNDEDIMLAEAFHVEDNSRLGCQIPITEQLDGLTLELAPQ